MQIQLRPNRSQIQAEETIRLDGLVQEIPALSELAPVQVQATVTRQDDDLYLVEARQTTKAVLTCARCLQPFAYQIEAQWQEHFSTSQADEEQEIYPITHQTIDLEPWIRETILVQLPFIPHCKKDCKGLCPVCGVNHNQTDCDCNVEVIDPRLAALRDLFPKDG